MEALLSGATTVPNVLLILAALLILLLVTFSIAVATDRNPLPFPDRDYHVFSTPSRSALAALERVMQKFGHVPRFRIDTDQVDRTIFSNGTIVNHPYPDLSARLGMPGGALGFVVSDPDEAARASAKILQESGFDAEVILNAEPGLSIAFVKTNALISGALVFRKHVLKMGKKPPAWTPR